MSDYPTSRSPSGSARGDFRSAGAGSGGSYGNAPSSLGARSQGSTVNSSFATKVLTERMRTPMVKMSVPSPPSMVRLPPNAVANAMAEMGAFGKTAGKLGRFAGALAKVSPLGRGVSLALDVWDIVGFDWGANGSPGGYTVNSPFVLRCTGTPAHNPPFHIVQAQPFAAAQSCLHGQAGIGSGTNFDATPLLLNGGTITVTNAAQLRFWNTDGPHLQPNCLYQRYSTAGGVQYTGVAVTFTAPEAARAPSAQFMPNTPPDPFSDFDPNALEPGVVNAPNPNNVTGRQNFNSPFRWLQRWIATKRAPSERNETGPLTRRHPKIHERPGDTPAEDVEVHPKTDVKPKPGVHVRARTKVGVRERKFKLAIGGSLANVISGVTEAADFLDCMWKNLPPRMKSRAKKGGSVSRGQRALDVYDAVGQMNDREAAKWFCGTMKCALEEQVQDFLIGRFAQLGPQALGVANDAGYYPFSGGLQLGGQSRNKAMRQAMYNVRNDPAPSHDVTAVSICG